MAIFRFEAKIISRNGGSTSTVGAAAYQSGKCVTSAAAYRHGEQMTDERTGQTFDYSNKKGVLGSEIILPDGAPEWMADRTQLWNTVEKIEKRRDSQLARDFIISLPHELTDEQRRALLREFIGKHLTEQGYVADCAYHAPPKSEGLNWHAHVMVPMRKVTEDGFAKKKERPEGNPKAIWRTELEHLREDWAAHVNRHLEAAGIDARVDHRSNADQGIEREPEPKLGPLAAKIEAEGRESHAGTDLRVVRLRNAERGRLRGELAGLTAEIIDLQQERMKRVDGYQPDPKEIDPAVYEKQRDELLERIAEMARQANQEQTTQERMREEFNKRNADDAEKAKKHQDDIRAQQDAAEQDDPFGKGGGITNAGLRYAQALGAKYRVKDPYASLAEAAMEEFRLFAVRQQELQRLASATDDPVKKQDYKLIAGIEGCGYMRATSHRLGPMTDTIVGKHQSVAGNADRERAIHWQKQEASLKAERAALLRGQREDTIARAKETAAAREQVAEEERVKDRYTSKDKNYNSHEEAKKKEATATKEDGTRETGDAGKPRAHAAAGQGRPASGGRPGR